MKKFFLIGFIIACFPMSVFAEKDDGDHFYVKNVYGDVHTAYAVRAENRTDGAYMGIRGDLSLLNWKNEYKDQDGIKLGSDNFSGEALLGLDLFAGYKFNQNIRADLELGYIGKYSETETESYLNYATEKTVFDLETYYLIANGYYDFKYGLYAGAGIGAAITNMSVDNSNYAKEDNTHVSPMWALMFGWTHKLDDRIDFDLRYRFAMFHGGEVTVNTGGGLSTKAEVGYIMNNSLSAGVRYRF